MPELFESNSHRGESTTLIEEEQRRQEVLDRTSTAQHTYGRYPYESAGHSDLVTTTEYASEYYPHHEHEPTTTAYQEGEETDQERERQPIKRPGFDPGFECNVNTLNRYNIHDVYCVNFDADPLGDGGFGAVFLGTHLFVEDSPVAVKEITFEISHYRTIDYETLVHEMDQKVAEITILRQFRHAQHMVHMHEYFVSPVDPATNCARLYIVTEFLEGGELFECIIDRYKRRKPFTEADVRDIFRILLEAVAFMHQRSVVHRDLKPSNLLLQVRDEPTSLKVSDFGQSKQLAPGEKAMTVCGTPGYRAPELWEKKPYDYSADLFSTGVILFFLLAGYQPFSCYKKHQIPAKTVLCEYKADRESWKRVSDDAKSLVRGFLTKAERRITLQQALEHTWMVSENVRYLKYDLRENVKDIEKNLEQNFSKEHETTRGKILSAEVTQSYYPSSYQPSGEKEKSSPLVPTFSRQSSVRKHYLNSSLTRNSSSVPHKSQPVESVSPEQESPPLSPLPITPPVQQHQQRMEREEPQQLSNQQHSHVNLSQPRPEQSQREDSEDIDSSRCCGFLFAKPKKNRPMNEAAVATAQVSVVSPISCTDIDQAATARPGSSQGGESDSSLGDLPGLLHTRQERHVNFSPGHTTMHSSSGSFNRSYGNSMVFNDASVVMLDVDGRDEVLCVIDHILKNIKETDYTEAVARRYCRMMLEAVARLHEKQIVHRNISFKNLLVSPDGQTIFFSHEGMMKYARQFDGECFLTGYCGTPYR